MFVNGCHIVPRLDSASEEDFSSIVSRSVVIGQKIVNGEQVDDIRKVERGPFLILKEAILYAHAWSDIDNPPEIKKPEPKTPAAEPQADAEVPENK